MTCLRLNYNAWVMLKQRLKFDHFKPWYVWNFAYKNLAKKITKEASNFFLNVIYLFLIYLFLPISCTYKRPSLDSVSHGRGSAFVGKRWRDMK